MLAIKLSPVGKKKQISYRIVINEKRTKFDGKCVEDLGWYNPHTNKFLVNAERVKHWLASGAQPTDSVHNILVTAKLIEGAKIPLHKKSKNSSPAGEPKTPAETQPTASKPEAPVAETKTEEKAEAPTGATETPAQEEKTEEKPQESESVVETAE